MAEGRGRPDPNRGARGLSALLAERLVEGGIPADRAAVLSATLMAASEGAVILARAEQSFEPFDQVAQELLATIKAAMSAEA
jgi:TetR/AcrR family transcriptional repressor of lmrAB and yxaGH operons